MPARVARVTGTSRRQDRVRSGCRLFFERVPGNGARGEAAETELQQLRPMHAQEPLEQVELEVQQRLRPEQLEGAVEHPIARAERRWPDEEMADRGRGRMEDLDRTAVEQDRAASARRIRQDAHPVERVPLRLPEVDVERQH